MIDAVHWVPPGAWAVGVSGGADSVALLALLRQRGDLSLHVVHLDHQTRGQESDEDARFVQELAAHWSLPCTAARREQLETEVQNLPANPSARYRRLRLALFERVVADHSLQGVILAHHADDQAETVLQRLLRSSGPMGLTGMLPRTTVRELVVVRPLLSVRSEQLRVYLRGIDQPWRVDSSNESAAYLRNRLRRILCRFPHVFEALIELSRDCRRLRDWIRGAAPTLSERFAASQLADLPDLLARESARRWLIDRGVPADKAEPAVIARLLTMARDAASPARMQFPSRVLIRRSRGNICAE